MSFSNSRYFIVSPTNELQVLHHHFFDFYISGSPKNFHLFSFFQFLLAGFKRDIQ